MNDRSLDELMWLIADEGDHSAVEAFIKRHPEHRAELIQRVNMVRDMRGAKPPHAEETAAPAKFQPRGAIQPLEAPRSPRWVYATALLALGVVAWGSFALTRQFVSSPPPASQPAPLEARQEVPVRPPVAYDPNQNVVPPSPPPAPTPTPAQAIVRLDEETTDLVTVLNAITQQSGLKIEIAPGMGNPVVTARYPGTEALLVLKDLGRRYSFTVFEQEDGHVLLIPAVDPSVPNPTQPTESTPPTERDPAQNPARSDEQLPEVSP